MYFNEKSENNTNIDSEFQNKNGFNFDIKKVLIILGIFLFLILIIFLISKLKKKTEYYLVVNGNEDIILLLGSNYNEQGCKAYDSKGKDHTKEVTIEGEVNTGKVGEYIVECHYKDLVKRKTITVINNSSSQTFLTLNGDEIIYLKLGEKYIEPGYDAIDATDPDIKNKVNVTNNINESAPGTYKVTYKIEKSTGEVIIKERTVIVMSSNINLYYDTNSYTKDKVSIKIYVNDNYFDYILLPNGNKKTEREFTYEVTENGKYKFTLYNKKELTEEKEIEVKTIDKEAPTGSCNATIGTNTIIKANFKDNNRISSYTYIIDNKEVKTTNNNSLTYSNTKEVGVKVKAIDVAGNETTKDCKVEVNKPKESSKSQKPSTPKVDQTAKVVTGGNSWVVNKDDFYIINTKNDVSSLEAKFRAGGIGSKNFPDKCLSFAYTYAYLLVYGTSSQINSLTGEKGASYSYGSFTGYDTDNLVEYLQKIYELLSQDRPVIIHVNGNLEGTSRHYVTAVGYKKGKTKETMLQTDLLIIDSYDGALERMDASNSRFLITGYATGRKGSSGYGYRLYILK